jgi:hypothetical protein
MQGTTSKSRAPKDIDVPASKDIGKAPNSRKAKDLALKAKRFSHISDDEEEPLAHVVARKRIKDESDSEDAYIDSETEAKRGLKKRIKREEGD